MDITLTDALLLGAVLAILMINFASRRAVTSQASRMFVRDHLKNIRHTKHHKTLLVLRTRLSLLSGMVTFVGIGVLLSLVAAVFAMLEWDSLANITFVAGLLAGVVSLLQSVRESGISNRAHFDELDATVSKDDPYHGAPGP